LQGAPTLWGRKDCRLRGQSLVLAAIVLLIHYIVGLFMRQFGFFLGIAIGVILILFGSIVIFQALPAALDVLEMPSRIPSCARCTPG
jgi:xanthine/uracil permease